MARDAPDHAHTLSGQQELLCRSRMCGHSTETHFPNSSEAERGGREPTCAPVALPGRTEAKASGPTGDPFDGQMQGSKRTELLHAGATSGRGSTLPCTRRTRHRGGHSDKLPPTADGGAENTGLFHETVTAFSEMTLSWAALLFLELPIFIDRK